MKAARIGLLIFLLSISIVALASPTVLIYQSKVLSNGKDDPNVDITKDIAHEYDANGRLTPVVYSMTDPTFKAAVIAGSLRQAPEFPQTRQVFNVARDLRAEYTIVVESALVGKIIKAKLRLFRDRRQIWKDENNLSVDLEQVMDPVTTARSIAHTFVMRMDGGPFKSLPDQIKTQSPVLQPGQSPAVTPILVKITLETTDADLKKDVDALIKANKTQEAILKVRDAVDAAPFDLERRLSLIDLLQTTTPVAAAEEARRAAIVMPDKVELRVMSARAWMRAGQPDEAQKDLNEAVARDPNGSATRLLLGELSMGKLEPAKALPHLDEAIKVQDSGSARFLRAICRALLGGTDGMMIDLAQADKLEPSRSPDLIARRYAQATEITDRALAQDGNDLRSIIPKIVVKPKDQGLKDELDQLLRVLQSRTALLTALTVPANLKLPQDQRILAYKLLTQCILDVQSYSNSSDEDTLAEARINLGEAMKQLAAARNALTLGS